MIKNRWAKTRIGRRATWPVRSCPFLLAHTLFLLSFLYHLSLPRLSLPDPISRIFRSPAPLSTEEHHISNFDPQSFFLLHDYDGSHTWTATEISRTYGLDDESAKEVPEQKRQEVVKGVLEKFDLDRDGVISREEWYEGWQRGMRLPDFGVS